MARRLTLLTPMGFLHVRLRSAFYRRRVGFLCFGLSLVIAACILLWPIGQRTQAAGSPHVVPTDRLVISNMPEPAVEISETALAPKPAALPMPTLTPLPIPGTGLVWASESSGAYLRESPETNILTHLPNGTQVKFLEGRAWYGDLPWVQVHSPSGEGWILQTQVYREIEDPVAYVSIQAGTYLRDQPGGGIQQTLSIGTPIMNILETRAMEGRNWTLVEVVDGTVGWVVEDWLALGIPTGELDD